jgi:septum site-determining protein MinC
MNASNAVTTGTDSSGTAAVSLRGTRRGLEIVVEAGASVDAIAAALEARLDQSPRFFAGADVAVRCAAPLPQGSLGRIEDIAARYELRIVEIGPPPVEPLPAEASAPALAPPAAEAQPAAEPEPEPGPAAPRTLVGPIRSGSRIETAGDLIVFGDVNPGAEVRAGGNVVVLGTLRGIAHAGQRGEVGFILALRFEAQQLRIGGHIARAGDSDRPAQNAEIAYVAGDRIIVESYQGKLPGGAGAARG